MATTKKESTKAMDAETKKAEEKNKDYLNEEVEIMLHKDDGKYKDDVVVILNGTALVVPRGKKVKIKRKYALIIEQSLGQKAETAARISTLAEKEM